VNAEGEAAVNEELRSITLSRFEVESLLRTAGGGDG
jgi:hypothetical protein